MPHALDDLVPLAVAIAISPIPVLAVVFMLLSDHGRRNAVLFLAGWTLTLVVVAGALALAGVGSGRSADRWVAIGELVVAAVLLVAAALEWRHRPRHGARREPPAWMRGVERFRPAQAFGLGVALIALNPKDGGLTLTAGAKLAQAALPAGQALLCLLIFAAISSVTVVVPLAAVLLLGDRAMSVLTAIRDWLERSGSVAAVVALVVLAVILAVQGVHGLA